MSGNVLTLEGIAPKVDASVWIAPTASVIGRVEIGAESSVWYGCVVRGDGDWIRIGARTNLQDGTVVHINEEMPCTVGSDITIGHMCLIHACTLEDGCFIGMRATVMDLAVVEGGAMVAAGAVVTPGKRVRRGEVWAGVPAKPWRAITPHDLAEFERIKRNYVERSRLYLGPSGPGR